MEPGRERRSQEEFMIAPAAARCSMARWSSGNLAVG
jgi:hypothetical protein